MRRLADLPVLPCVLAAALLAGCARYAPLALPTRPGLAASVGELRLGAAMAGHRLTAGDLAALAVANSPDLAAARLQRNAAQAQMLQAGLLANPTVTGSVLPLVAGPAAPNGAGSSATLGWTAGLSYDVRSLVTRGSRRREAAAAARGVDAALLWQEWQTAAQARLLCVDLIEGDRLLALLREQCRVIARRADAVRAALAAGNVTLATAAPDLASLAAARNAVLEQARVQLGRRQALAALLGLAPDAAVLLADAPGLPAIDADAILRGLASLPERRPDLAALRFGYQAADARLRTAILSQFPNIGFGIAGGSDNSNVRNVGPQLSLELPVFDHGQGLVAGALASRAQLRAEYAARLAGAMGQVRAMLGEMAMLRGQLDELRRELPAVARMAAAAAAASAAGNLDERSALDLILAQGAREQAVLGAEQALLEQAVGVATVAGVGFREGSVLF